MITDNVVEKMMTDEKIERVSTLEKDCVCIRVEPELSESDFKEGHEFLLGVEVLDEKDNVILTYSATVVTGEQGNGEPPYMLVRDDELFRNARVRTFCRCITKDKPMIECGLRECTAEKTDDALPMAIAVPVADVVEEKP